MSIRDTDKDWQVIALENPYWGVLSVDEFRGKDLAEESFNAFFRSGQSFIGNLIGLIRAHIVPNFSVKRSLDFGCGVGRLLVPMAHISETAVGVDIAPAMLDICRSNLERLKIENCSLALSDDTLSKVDGMFDFINTYIVLQHIPPQRGYKLLGSLLSRLQIGGCASIQITYAKSRRFFQHEIGTARAYRRDGDTITDILPIDDTVGAGRIVMYDYDLNRIVAMISEVAGLPIIMLPTRDDDHLGVHFIFARSR